MEFASLFYSTLNIYLCNSSWLTENLFSVKAQTTNFKQPPFEGGVFDTEDAEAKACLTSTCCARYPEVVLQCLKQLTVLATQITPSCSRWDVLSKCSPNTRLSNEVTPHTAFSCVLLWIHLSPWDQDVFFLQKSLFSLEIPIQTVCLHVSDAQW